MVVAGNPRGFCKEMPLWRGAADAEDYTGWWWLQRTHSSHRREWLVGSHFGVGQDKHRTRALTQLSPAALSWMQTSGNCSNWALPLHTFQRPSRGSPQVASLVCRQWLALPSHTLQPPSPSWGLPAQSRSGGYPHHPAHTHALHQSLGSKCRLEKQQTALHQHTQWPPSDTCSQHWLEEQNSLTSQKL